jgi:hypothetical protein
MEFIHRISKGSRYNQIYIPREMKDFEVGDIVKVVLLEKKAKLFSSGNFDLGEIKQEIVNKIFKQLRERAFIVGSFLFKKADYRDIDILLISGNEEKVYNLLTEKLELKFHVLAMKEDAFNRLIKICPLTRSMLSYFISNKELELPEQEYDKNHIQFLLMMPEDLLKIDAGSRAFYDSLRRLIAIERFLEEKKLDSQEIEQELEKLLGSLFKVIKENKSISKKQVAEIRKLIKIKLKKINKFMKKWEKQA